MSCLKNFHKIGLFISSLVFFVAFSVLFFSNTNVSAISDIIYTFDFSSIPSWYDICQGSSDCSSFNFMKVEPSTPSSCSGAVSFYVGGLTLGGNLPVSPCITSLYFLNSPDHVWITGGSSGSYSGDITITLSESFGSASSGSITLSANGTYDVSSYATAVVDVPPVVEQGDYHDDLVSIQHAIYICAGVMLVLYFFYCIYRMLIKSTGGH